MPKYTQKMCNEWKDFRLDEAPPMYKGAKKSAQKDVDSLDKNFKMMIKEEWNKTKFGYEEIYFNDETNNGWVNYITKSKSEDKVDWESFYRV